MVLPLFQCKPLQEGSFPFRRITAVFAFLVSALVSAFCINDSCFCCSNFQYTGSKGAQAQQIDQQSKSQNSHKHIEVGSKAPKLSVNQWVHGKKLPSFRKGEVFVVVFWKIDSNYFNLLAHLWVIQNRLSDQPVHFVLVTSESLKSVEELSAKKIHSKKVKSYGEIFNSMFVAIDKEKSAHHTYLEGAHVKKLPTAFIIGKQGTIQWIGSAFELEKVLTKILSGDWNLAGYKRKIAAPLQWNRMFDQVIKLKNMKKYSEAIGILDNMDKLKVEPPLKRIAKLIRSRIQFESGGKEAEEVFDDLLKLAGTNPILIHRMAMQIVEKEKKKKGTYTKNVLAKAERASEKVLNFPLKKKLKGNLLNTHAQLLYLNGKLDEAIGYQRSALKLLPSKDMKDFLIKLEKESDKSRLPPFPKPPKKHGIY